LCNHPSQTGVTIFKRRWVWVFWGQPIINGDANYSVLVAPSIEARIIHFAVTDDKATTVHPVHAWASASHVLGTMNSNSDTIAARYRIVSSLNRVRQWWRGSRSKHGSNLDNRFIGERTESCANVDG
jgi:hypothetical protein